LALEEMLTKEAPGRAKEVTLADLHEEAEREGARPMEHLNAGDSTSGTATGFDDMPEPVAFSRGSKPNIPVDHEHAALLQKFEHAAEVVQQRGVALDVTGSRDACRAARDLFARYMEAGADVNKIGWLNLEVKQLLDRAPWPKRLL
jgi:hypothetical protein